MKTRQAREEPHKIRDLRRFVRLCELYEACLRNAIALIEDAELLLAANRPTRAFVLALTAWEELGKSQLVADFAYGMAAKKEFEAAFYDHRIKSAYNWRRFELNRSEREASTITYDTSKANTLLKLRNSALYVQKRRDESPISPCSEITSEFATEMVRAARREHREIRAADYLTESMGSRSFMK